MIGAINDNTRVGQYVESILQRDLCIHNLTYFAWEAKNILNRKKRPKTRQAKRRGNFRTAQIAGGRCLWDRSEGEVYLHTEDDWIDGYFIKHRHSNVILNYN